MPGGAREPWARQGFAQLTGAGRGRRRRGFAELTVAGRDGGAGTGLGVHATDDGRPGSDGGAQLTVAAREEAEGSHN